MNVEKAQRAARERRREQRRDPAAPVTPVDPRWPNGCPNPYLEAAMVSDGAETER